MMLIIPTFHLLFLSFLSHVTGLIEHSGFHCSMEYSMQLNRQLHGPSQLTTLPFFLKIVDRNDHSVSFYEPNKTYTVKLFGFVYYRGLLIQPRLADQDRNLIGSLKGGRFIEKPIWNQYGIRFLNCSKSTQLNDSITHKDDKKKFVTNIQWTTERDIGPVQFLITLAQEDDFYWEKWRPESGFLLPINLEAKIQPHQIVIFLRGSSPMPIDLQASASIATNPLIVGTNKSASSIRDEFEKLIRDRTALNIHQSEGRKRIIRTEITRTTTVPIVPFNNQEKQANEQNKTNKKEIVFVANIDRQQSGSSNENGNVAPFSVDDTQVLFTKHHLKLNACKNVTCKNGGRCKLDTYVDDYAQDYLDENYICICKSGWTGQSCEFKDNCHNHQCKNGVCNNSNNTYTCQCFDEYVGKYCNRKCPNDYCKKNGTCFENEQNRLSCHCPPGSTGEKCQIEINECKTHPCRNRGVCVDKWNDFECQCKDGWMGKTCQSPCQDVYRSCDFWRRQDQCILMRSFTDFFDVNCAVSCRRCRINRKTIRTFNPLAPVLLPLSWLLGVWTSIVKSNVNIPFNFPKDEHYEQTLTFLVTSVMMFGTPSINFSSISISEKNPSERHVQNGFLTIKQQPKHNQTAALITTTNHGMTIIEEGRIQRKTIEFTPHFQSLRHSSKEKVAVKMVRTLRKIGPMLFEEIVKEYSDGWKEKVGKHFIRRKPADTY